MPSAFSLPTKMDSTADAVLRTFDAIQAMKATARSLHELACELQVEARELEDNLLRLSGNLKEGTGGTS